jgi:hypothetical protein
MPRPRKFDLGVWSTSQLLNDQPRNYLRLNWRVFGPHKDARSHDEPQLHRQGTHLHSTKEMIRRCRPEEEHVKSTKKLTFHSLAKIFNLTKEESLCIRS